MWKTCFLLTCVTVMCDIFCSFIVFLWRHRWADRVENQPNETTAELSEPDPPPERSPLWLWKPEEGSQKSDSPVEQPDGFVYGPTDQTPKHFGSKSTTGYPKRGPENRDSKSEAAKGQHGGGVEQTQWQSSSVERWCLLSKRQKKYKQISWDCVKNTSNNYT